MQKGPGASYTTVSLSLVCFSQALRCCSLWILWVVPRLEVSVIRMFLSYIHQRKLDVTELPRKETLWHPKHRKQIQWPQPKSDEDLQFRASTMPPLACPAAIGCKGPWFSDCFHLNTKGLIIPWREHAQHTTKANQDEEVLQASAVRPIIPKSNIPFICVLPWRAAKTVQAGRDPGPL